MFGLSVHWLARIRSEVHSDLGRLSQSHLHSGNGIVPKTGIRSGGKLPLMAVVCAADGLAAGQRMGRHRNLSPIRRQCAVRHPAQSWHSHWWQTPSLTDPESETWIPPGVPVSFRPVEEVKETTSPAWTRPASASADTVARRIKTLRVMIFSWHRVACISEC